MAPPSSTFAHAHAAVSAGGGLDWEALTRDAAGQLGGAASAPLGFIYVTDHLAGHLPQILKLLRQITRIGTWIGGVGLGVAATGVEYYDRPALVLLTADLPDGSWRLIPNLTDHGRARTLARELAQAVTPKTDGLSGMPLGIVHADPRNSQLGDIVASLAGGLSGFLVGGLTSARGDPDQVAGEVVRGGVSGIVLSPDVAVATGLSQGCSPVGPVRTITSAQENILIELDGRPALEVFKEDIGELLSRRLERVGNYIHAAFPVSGSDTGDYLVRNLAGIDAARNLVAVGQLVETGDKILFVRRDRQAAEEDLVRMLRRLKRGTAAPKAGLYFSCVARGPNMFGPDSAELGILRRELGEFPLIGLFCDGEISNDRLYGYTGVLTLFL